MPTSIEDFESVFPLLVDDLTAHCKQYSFPKTALEWYQKSLNHNTLGGKLNRGLSIPDTASLLLPNPITPASPDFFPTCTLGWLIELLQAFFLVSDDIMDASLTRRGQPCWYRLPSVNMIAINDSFMLESAIFILLKKHFRRHRSYIDLMELFHETTFQTELGQTCDLLTAPEDHVNLNNFSMEKYLFIVRFKTAYYSFYLPVALALHYCELATEDNLRQAREILIPMGTYFQVQDDYLDAYGDPQTLGKIGTDIQDNKCSWLVNQALQRASTEQRSMLDENYGRKHKSCEAKVKEVYHELKLDDVYKDFEEKSVNEIRRLIEAVDESEGLKKEVFEVFLKKIYRRNK